MLGRSPGSPPRAMMAPLPKRWTIASIALPMIERTSPFGLVSEDLGVERRTAMRSGIARGVPGRWAVFSDS